MNVPESPYQAKSWLPLRPRRLASFSVPYSVALRLLRPQLLDPETFSRLFPPPFWAEAGPRSAGVQVDKRLASLSPSPADDKFSVPHNMMKPDLSLPRMSP